MGPAIDFKFHRLNSNGAQTTTFRKRGRVDDDTLVLDRETIPIASIRAAASKFDRLIIVSDGGSPGGQQAVHVVVVDRRTLRTLLPRINTRISALQCAARRAELVRAGRGHEFRQETCPGCACSLDLGRHPHSPEVYCRFCDTVWAVPEADAQRRQEEPSFRTCQKCGLYARPTEFSTGYIVFLLVVYMYKFEKRDMCHSCMRSVAWKMVGINLLGLIGEALAVPQLIRAYAGGSTTSKTFARLDAANSLAKSGRVEQASALYDEMIARLGHSAGVRHNQGLTRLRAGQVEQAALLFAQSLEDCANYPFAADWLGICYEKLGMTAELEQLKREWSDQTVAGAPA